ncbi:hypothetical protein ElyMa_006329500 [Elysia marginata]|uniref:Uncharacterized protein n=1 Tax=Elysia marginata TaxID=1093978 RepID=A0AAV4HHN5_9GAST|nr:hypothetical protein ElyMa_006329500 [Elysia marginata]
MHISEDVLHQSLVSTWAVGQAEGKPTVFIKTEGPYGESCPLSVLFRDLNLIVPTLHVKDSEKVRPREAVEDIFNPWEMRSNPRESVSIFNGPGMQLAKVCT